MHITKCLEMANINSYSISKNLKKQNSFASHAVYSLKIRDPQNMLLNLFLALLPTPACLYQLAIPKIILLKITEIIPEHS